MRISNSLIVVAFLITGCAKVWVKPGASTDEFNQDKFACIQQSQQQVSTLAVGKYGGFGQSAPETNWMMYNSCMTSRGWALTDQQSAASSNSQVKNEIELEQARLKQIDLDRCSDKKFASFYAKTPCFAKDLTLEQLADKSKVTANQKSIMSTIRREVKDVADQRNALFRKYGGNKGSAIASYDETIYTPKIDQVYLNLYNGKITWGEFNQQRKDNYDQYMKKYKEIFGN